LNKKVYNFTFFFKKPRMKLFVQLFSFTSLERKNKKGFQFFQKNFFIEGIDVRVLKILDFFLFFFFFFF